MNGLEIDYLDQSQYYKYEIDIEGLDYDDIINDEKKRKILEDQLSNIPQYLYLDEE